MGGPVLAAAALRARAYHGRAATRSGVASATQAATHVVYAGSSFPADAAAPIASAAITAQTSAADPRTIVAMPGATRAAAAARGLCAARRCARVPSPAFVVHDAGSEMSRGDGDAGPAQWTVC